jgi:hypothetical protein
VHLVVHVRAVVGDDDQQRKIEVSGGPERARGVERRLRATID